LTNDFSKTYKNLKQIDFCNLTKYEGQLVYIKAAYTGVDEYWALNSIQHCKNRVPELNSCMNLSQTSSTLAKGKRAIVDTSSKMVYVLYKDFSRRYYLTYIIDGKSYKQETGLSEAYGLIKNNPKENKDLKDKLASLNLDNYTVNVYKGLDAYKKFGYDNVFGVIVLKQKE
jgi:hypothetical protein